MTKKSLIFAVAIAASLSMAGVASAQSSFGPPGETAVTNHLKCVGAYISKWYKVDASPGEVVDAALARCAAEKKRIVNAFMNEMKPLDPVREDIRKVVDRDIEKNTRPLAISVVVQRRAESH